MKKYGRYGSGGLLACMLTAIVALMIGQALDAYASSLTEVKKTYVDRGQPPLSVYALTVTMDSGGTHSHAMTEPITGRVVAVKTNPGSPAPSDNYDLDLLVDGYDIMGGALANRDSANSERAWPLFSDGTDKHVVHAPVAGALTFGVDAASNLVENATVTIRVYTIGEKKGTLSW